MTWMKERSLSLDQQSKIGRVVDMSEWVVSELRIIGVLVALATLLSTLLYRWFSWQQREFESLLQRIDRESAERQQRFDRESAERQRQFDKESAERQRQFDKESAERQQQINREAVQRQQQIDREAEKRERASELALERSDRVFERLTARIDELAKDLADVAQRIARIEARLDVLMAGLPRVGPQSVSAADEPRAIAAQHIPDEPPAE